MSLEPWANRRYLSLGYGSAKPSGLITQSLSRLDKTRLAKKRPLPSPATWVAFRDSEATEWNGISYANFYAMLKR